MPFLSIDQFDNPGQWSALDAADAPSGELALSADGQPHPQAQDSNTLRLDVSANATGHLIRRALGPIDLTAFPNLTLWYRATTAQAGQTGDAFRLRLRLGSAALPIGAPGNDWHRYLTASKPGQWSYVLIDLDDLPAAVRGAVTTIEYDVVDVQSEQSVWFDALEARAPSTVTDIDASLVGRLDGALVLNGTPVPVVVAPDVPAQPAEPFIRLVHYESSHSRRRATDAPRRSDFTETGSGLRPTPVPWDLFYRAEFVATDRADQSAMVDFAMTQLGHRSWLPIGNQAVRIEQIPTVLPDDALIDAPIIRYRVAAWLDQGRPELVLPVTETNMTIDSLAGGAA